MDNTKITHNPYLFFSPFLIGLIIYVIFTGTSEWYGDGIRYINSAKNLLNGFYSPPAPNISLVHGPGYPILLVPFLAFRLPLVYIGIINAVFFYFSIIIIYKILLQFVSIRISTIISLFWACYINAYQDIPWIQCETLSIFLVTLIVYYTVKAFNSESHYNRRKYLYLAGFFIGYLTLTKIIFGYVLLSMFIGSVVIWIINRDSLNRRKGVIILLIALLTTSPYLIYTYHLTGKIFYWSEAGSDTLYWMSTPYKGEYGDWYSLRMIFNDSSTYSNLSDDNRETLISNHKNDFEEIIKYNRDTQSDVFKKIAVNNIKTHPDKYILNLFSNVGRILFDIPYSYKLQKPQHLLRLPFNGIIIVFALITLIPTYINWRKINYSIRFLLFFALIYFCSSILVSGETRMFTIIVPILLVWIAFVIVRMVKIDTKF